MLLKEAAASANSITSVIKIAPLHCNNRMKIIATAQVPEVARDFRC
jgi:hypothetical protein